MSHSVTRHHLIVSVESTRASLPASSLIMNSIRYKAATNLPLFLQERKVTSKRCREEWQFLFQRRFNRFASYKRDSHWAPYRTNTRPGQWWRSAGPRHWSASVTGRSHSSWPCWYSHRRICRSQNWCSLQPRRGRVQGSGRPPAGGDLVNQLWDIWPSDRSTPHFAWRH